MVSREQAEFIVTVLEQSLARRYGAPPEVEAACASIGRRYSELKSDHDFTTAAQTARVEWLLGVMNS
jgi:hypothetical protein